jgi:hypothetical protein
MIPAQAGQLGRNTTQSSRAKVFHLPNERYGVQEVIFYRGRLAMREQRHFFSDQGWLRSAPPFIFASRLSTTPPALVVRFVDLRRSGLKMLGLTRQHGGRILRLEACGTIEHFPISMYGGGLAGSAASGETP